jgi:DNA-directed RNA polymerase subunit RPC12/RpoP
MIAAICILAAIGGLVFAIHWNLYKNYHYICTKCGTHFKPANFRQSLFGINAGEQRGIKCPVCNKIVWATAVKDKEN